MKPRFDRSASHRPSRITILVAAAAAVGVLALLSYLAAVAPRGVPAVSYYEVTAEFRDSADLRLLSAVSVAGRRVGQVSRIRTEDGVAKLRLQLQPGTTKLLSDSTARIRLKNPVGAKYVEITPGRAGRPLASGDVIPARQTSASVDTPELLSTFDAPTRRNVRKTVGGLGKGFLGRGQGINATLPETPEFLDDAVAVSDAVLARRGAAKRFFPSLERLADAYDPVREPLAAGFRPQAQALEAFAAERGTLQDLLEVAPPALTDLRTGLDRSRPLLDETAGFARALTRLTAPAPAAFREATALLREGAPALDDTRPLLDSVSRSVPPTLSLLRTTDPVIVPTRNALQSQIRPLSEFGGPRQCDVLTWARNWRSALGFGVPANADPTSDLDASQGLGPNQNSFRVLGVPEDDAEALSPDGPEASKIAAGRTAYPAPCVASGERLK